jgi:hypothetical protein
MKPLGFAPDLDPTTAGVLIGVTNAIPYESGMKGAPTGATPSSTPALVSDCRGAAVVTKLDDTRRIFAGTATKLYELVTGSWVDVSSGSYSGSFDTRWVFSQFGNATIASNQADTIQRSTGVGFTAIAGAPKAKIVFSVGTQIMALNTNDGTVKNDGWHCCATYDETSWTPSIATLCASGRVVSTAGSFTAGGRLGDFAVAYKDRAIYLGQFVGAPTVWDWSQVAGGDAGCVGQDAWCDIGGTHFIVGIDNFYLFDGSRPVAIGDDSVRQWFYQNSNPALRYKTQCVYDRQNNHVWVFYCHVSGSILNRALVYHMRSKMWGRVEMTVEALVNYVSAGVTINELPSYSATIDGLSSYSFDSQFWLSGGRSLAVFNESNQLQSLTAPCGASSITTGYIGDDDANSLLTQVRLRFAPGYKPLTANVETYSKMELGNSESLASSGIMSDGKFDVLDSARWHNASFSFAGDWRLLDISVKIQPDGDV